MLCARALTVSATALAALVAAGCGGTSKAGGKRAVTHPVVLQMGNELGDIQPLSLYADEVSRLTDGSVRIAIHTGDYRGRPDAERRILADVRSGRDQLAWTPPRVLDTLGNRRFEPLVAPLLIDSYALEQKVVESPLMAPMLASLRSLGVVGLGVEPGPMRRLLGIRRAIRRPADLHGQVVGIAQSALEARAVRALGGVPRVFGPMAPATGLDALESQLNAIYGNLYFKHARAVTADIALWPRPLVFVANPAALARLSGPQREALRVAAANVVPAFTRFARSDDAVAMTGLCSAHVPFVHADVPAFRAALRPVMDTIEPRVVAAIEQLKRGVPSDPAPICGAAGGRPVAPRASTVLDGVYRKTLTPAQAHSGVPENYGTFVKVFDRGRFAQTGRSPRACQWSYGHYVLRGATIRFINTDGGGITPTNAGAKPGETVDMHWRLFRGSLLFTAPEDPDPGAWQRISSTPSSKYFERRCPPPANWDG